MSKAILVMDTPERCKDCDVYVCYKQYAGDPGDEFCGIKCEDVNGEKRPDWCPLREVKKKTSDNLLDEYSDGYDDGWNACIDEILKGSEVG